MYKRQPSALTQNVKDLLASREIEAILDNTDFMILLSQAQSDRAILAKQLGISEHQLSYITPVSYTHLDVYKRQGYGSDNPGSKSQGMKQLMAGGGIILLGTTLIPLLSGLF